MMFHPKYQLQQLQMRHQYMSNGRYHYPKHRIHLHLFHFLESEVNIHVPPVVSVHQQEEGLLSIEL